MVTRKQYLIAFRTLMMGLVYQVFRCFRVINVLRIACDQAMNPFSKQAPRVTLFQRDINWTEHFNQNLHDFHCGWHFGNIPKYSHQKSSRKIVEHDAFTKQVQTILHVTLNNQPPIPEIPHIYPTNKHKPTKHASLCKLRKQSFPICLGLGYNNPLGTFP